jgi:DNA-binding MarR family transcriptional regulator
MDEMSSGQPNPPRRLWELPSWLVSQVAHQAQRLVGDALAVSGARRQHFTVLVALEEDGASSQAGLGRRLGIDRSDLHAVLNDLERDGFVVRVPDTLDRRRNAVELTSAGAGALEELQTKVSGAQNALLAPLSVDERSELIRLLTVLVEHQTAGA